MHIIFFFLFYLTNSLENDALLEPSLYYLHCKFLRALCWLLLSVSVNQLINHSLQFSKEFIAPFLSIYTKETVLLVTSVIQCFFESYYIYYSLFFLLQPIPTLFLLWIHNDLFCLNEEFLDILIHNLINKFLKDLLPSLIKHLIFI